MTELTRIFRYLDWSLAAIEGPIVRELVLILMVCILLVPVLGTTPSAGGEEELGCRHRYIGQESGTDASAPIFWSEFGYWSVITASEGSSNVCYMYSRPVGQGTSEITADFQPILFVTHRPAHNSFNVVSICAANLLRRASPPLINVGDQKFRFYIVLSNNAWAYDSDDIRIVSSMRESSKVIVSITAIDGSRENVMYSLDGFNDALNEMDRQCPEPIS